jgi:hypothetical protein
MTYTVLLFAMRFMTQTAGYLIFVHKQSNKRQIVMSHSIEEETGTSPLGYGKGLIPTTGLVTC